MRLSSTVNAKLHQSLQGLKRHLSRKLRVQRQGWSLHVVLDPVSDRPRRARASAGTGARATLMQRDLVHVLDHHPGTRRLFPALALVERALSKGDAALERLPLPVADEALRTLERLAGDWDGVGLAQLRQRLAARRPSRPASPSLEVQEASMSMFMEASAAWEPASGASGRGRGARQLDRARSAA